MKERELNISKAALAEKRKWSEHSKKLEALRVGHRVGTMIEVKQNDQYAVKVDGTGRITLRNRRNLRIIGYRKPADPFPDSVITSSTSTGGEREHERHLEQHKRNISSPPLEVYKDTSGRDEPCRSTPGSPSSARQSLVMNENQDTYFTPSVSVKTASKVSHDATTVQMSHSPVISPNAEAVGAWSVRVSGDDVVATPKRPVKVTQQPNEASPKVEVYRQLKSFNKPGLKEAKVDPEGPRTTRSGRSYTKS